MSHGIHGDGATLSSATPDTHSDPTSSGNQDHANDPGEYGREHQPLSYTQESLWLIHQTSAYDASAYNEALVFQISGTLSVAALREAVRQVVLRHASLRARFAEIDGSLRASIHDDALAALEIFDASGQPNPTQAAHDFVAAAVRQPFELRNGPLFRAALAKVGEQEWILVLAAHHIVTDAWSMGIILDELGWHYISLQRTAAPAALPALQCSYVDFVRRQRQAYERGGYDEKIEYWKRSLIGIPELLHLPTDRPRPARQAHRGAVTSVRIPRDSVAGLVDWCNRECGSTQFIVLLSAYAVLLYRYCAQERVCIGTTVLNRDEIEYLNIVGCFVNTAAIAFDLAPNLRFRDLLEQAREASIGLFEHHDAPYPKVLERLRPAHNPSHSPLFQTMLTALGARQLPDLGQGLTVRPHRVARTSAKFDLLIYAIEDAGEVEFEAEFNTDLFDRDTVDRLLRHYVCLLGELARDIDVEIGRVAILPAEERRTILETFNDTRTAYPEGDVLSLFEAQATRAPDAIAVEFAHESLSYAQLDRRANEVARCLQRWAEGGSGFVGVFMDRSTDMVVALVATLKAAMAYVPIDPDYPADRIGYMIENSQVPLVLASPKHMPVLRTLGVRGVVLAELLAEPHDAHDSSAPPRALSADSRCYMIYTSGSTGRPKGVINRHGALFNRLYWMQQQYRLAADDKVLQKTPFSFDVSVWEFFWPLMFGARIVMAAPGGHRDTDYLKRLIRERGITTVHFVPSMLNAFLEEDELASYCSSVRRVFCSGEALAYSTVERFLAELPCQLHNLYGPTEAAIDVSYWPCTLDYPGRVVPIGKPVANTVLYVVDTNLGLQPIGIPGELCIGGVQLAEGYHRRDELTAAAFVRNPYSGEAGARLYRTGDLARYRADGQIEYLGRIDNQVKLRGFRIELGEIEAVVRSLPLVREAVVLVREHGSQRLLVAYVVLHDAQTFDPAAATTLMKRQLPEFMIPQFFVPVDAIPLSVNGKLDRGALPDPLATDVVQAVANDTLPGTPTEEALARVWAEVLEQSRVAVDSNFFQLGGDSILSLRIVTRVRKLGYALEVRDLFAYPTVRELARHLRTADPEAVADTPPPFALVCDADRALLPADVTDAWPLTVLQAGMIYHSTRHPQSPVYHDIFSYDLHGHTNATALVEALRQVVIQRPQLRSQFDLGGYSEPLQLVLAAAEPQVEIADHSAASPAEQERALELWIEQEKRRDFDVEAAPPVRFHIQLRGPQRLMLSLAFHHAILDGWSVALVIEQIRRSYSALLAGRAIEDQSEQVPYSAYVALERLAVADPQQAMYWREQVGKIPPAAAHNPGETTSSPTASCERVIPTQLASGLQVLVNQAGVPLRTAMLAVHLQAMSQVGALSSGGMAVTGVVVNGRPELAGSEQAAGLFLNTLPLAQPPWQTGATAADMLRHLFAAEQSLLTYRRYPLAEILRTSNCKALFEAVFNFTDFHIYREAQPQDAVRITGARYFEQTNFPMVVHAHRDSFTAALGLRVNFDPARIRPDVVDAYLNAWLSIAASLAGPVSSVPECDESPLQRQLREVVAAAIGVVRIGLDDKYIELGVDSISALRIVSRLKRQRIRVSLEQLLSNTSVRALAASLEQGGLGADAVQQRERVSEFELAGRPRESFASDIVAAYPMTAMQLDMIRHHDVDPAQARYHDVFAYHLRLPLDPSQLRASLQRLIDAHESLRTSFELNASPEPLQRVHASATVRLETTDLSGLPESERRVALLAWLERERGIGFDSSRPELMRFHAHRHGEDAFSLTLSFHHSVIDGWSLSRLIAELVADYRAVLGIGVPSEAAPVPKLSYRDYVALERDNRRSHALRALWREELRGSAFAAFPRWPTHAPVRWSETKLTIEPSLHTALLSTASSHGVSIKHVLLAAHLVAVGLLQNNPDVSTCVFAGGRPEEEHSENLVGMFLNFVPCRTNIGAVSWTQLISACHSAERRTLHARRYPLSDIERDHGRDWIAQTAFNYTRFDAYQVLSGDTADGRGPLERVDWFEHTHFTLLANIGHDLQQQRLILTLNADGRSIPQAVIETIAGLYSALLAELVADERAPAARRGSSVELALSTCAGRA